MKSHVPVALSFLGFTSLCAAANTESGYLATITLAPTASGAAAFDLEEKRAECFQSCYKTYGNFNSCSRGGLEMCWCNASVDWVEREEDCVWSICGPSAYNEYATVLSRVCETVTASDNQAVETGSTSSDQKTTSATTSTTGQTSAETTSAPETPEPLASDSGTRTTSGEAAAATSAEPNGGLKMTSSVGVVFAISALQLVILAF
ncbi:hypothetical protein FPSE_06319 [Fusarium pseudograminearum CS3096]|uniref:Extracellular membrane protein CFEM domain-containing protein n=1 Tax=Fusarium pseudograminearum (strain CS3096) TaxID=1028729 RepID=K3UNB5_FUSPC|nr:hypothetical protein FPSE_06319 [Fusarium pseudograminearum CS3096]EKJ73701.1 hypothetical protein FPSE_06319 [Fusarium pseudograminearum CS3096]